MILMVRGKIPRGLRRQLQIVYGYVHALAL